MNKYVKVLSMALVLTSSAYLPCANANSSTEMLITIAEANPALVERLSQVALNDSSLVNQLLIMSELKPSQLERLLNLAEVDPETFKQLVTVFNANEGEISTFGIDDSGGIIRP